MKRLALVTLLLLGGVLNAHSDTDIYTNTTKQARSYDELQVDTEYCTQLLGEPQNGVPTPRPYKRCMLSHGWRYSHTVRERAAQDEYPDPDNPGLMCKTFVIGGITGSDCSNF